MEKSVKNRNKMLKQLGITVLGAVAVMLLFGVWGITGDFDR